MLHSIIADYDNLDVSVKIPNSFDKLLCDNARYWKLCLLCFSPVAGENKPLDELECKMYRRKSLLILLVEIIIWIIFTCVAKIESEVIPIIIFTEALMLLLGKSKI